MTNPIDIPFTTMDGEETTLRALGGERWLVVNVASACGATPQYAGLQSLHEAHQDLTVVGFPCNQFGRQEPGNSEQIRQFCNLHYDVNFPLLTKQDVNGANRSDLYQFLIGDGDDVQWNFEKFVLSRQGNVIHRLAPSVAPDQRVLIDAIEQALA